MGCGAFALRATMLTDIGHTHQRLFEEVPVKSLIRNEENMEMALWMAECCVKFVGTSTQGGYSYHSFRLLSYQELLLKYHPLSKT